MPKSTAKKKIHIRETLAKISGDSIFLPEDACNGAPPQTLPASSLLPLVSNEDMTKIGYRPGQCFLLIAYTVGPAMFNGLFWTLLHMQQLLTTTLSGRRDSMLETILKRFLLLRGCLIHM